MDEGQWRSENGAFHTPTGAGQVQGNAVADAILRPVVDSFSAAYFTDCKPTTLLFQRLLLYHFQIFCYTMRRNILMETTACSIVGKQRKYNICFRAEEVSI